MLRTRLAVLVAGSLLVALAAFGFAVDVAFVRLQRTQFEALLTRERDRVVDLVQRSPVGATFLDEDEAGLLLQFVGRDGTVQLPVGGGPALPEHDRPTIVVDAEGRARMVVAAPWTLPSGSLVGTVRLGLDLGGYVRARATLWRVLVAVGAVLAVTATAVALFLLTRALAPLARLVATAERLDPARPDLAGPVAAQARDDEVGRLADALDRAMQAVRERQRAERDALAEIAHELAAPLSVVAGRLRGIEAADATPEVTSAREAADELLHTSRDLLTLARGELERPLDLAGVELGRIARGVASETPGVQVDADAPVEVLGDPERLRQLVRNLVRNAVQAGSDADDVRIAVQRAGAEAHLTVVDRGPGLPEGAEASIFDRHVSGRPGGTGLGLAVARAIVEAHEGVIRAGPREGGGARFDVRLPSLDARLGDD